MSIISKITTTNGVTHDVIDSKYYAGDNVYIGELVPDGYNPVEYITNAQQNTYIRTEIAPDVDDYEIRLKFTAVSGESPLFINRRNNNGIGGGDGKICLYCSGQEVDCGLARIEGNIYETVAKVKNGDYTFRVTNLTTSATNTVSGSYRYSSDTNPFYLFSNSSDYAKPNCRIWYLQFFKAGKCELNYIPVEFSNPRGSYRFWDVVSQTLVNATGGLLGGGNAIDRRFDHYVSVPDYPVVGKLNTNNSTAQAVNSSESFSGTVKLHKISKTGSYNDLLNLPTIPSAADDAPLMDGDAAVGTSTDYAREDHVHPSDSNKQDKLTAGTDLEIVPISVTLPNGYTQLDYIQSTGAQCIDTGYSLTSTDTLEIDYILNPSSIGNDKFIARQLPYTWVENYGSSNQWYVRFGSSSSSNTTYNSSHSTGTIVLKKNYFGINGTRILQPSYNSMGTGGTLTLFGALTNGNVGYSSYITIKEARVKNSSDVIIHRYIPAKRNSDNAIGMYDVTAEGITSQGFRQNLSNTSFVAGSPTQTGGAIINFTNDTGYITSADLATVATSGSYNDLSDTPTIPNDNNLVHKTDDETVGGTKTFSNNVVLGTNSNLHLLTSQADGVYVEASDGDGVNKTLMFAGISDDSEVKLENVATPTFGTDAANKNYVDKESGSVTFNGYSNQYGIQPKSLCAFSASAGGATMYMTSFTTGGGTGNKVPASNLVFPIGCKIYYYDESEAFASMTAFTNKKFYSSFNGVDGRYSAITGYHLSLSSSSTSNVYMRVMVGSTLGYWSPFYKAGTTTEIFVTSDNLVSGEFYIHLGKTIGTNGVMFQLEDNNPLYYYDATNGLTDWATYVAKTYGGSSYVAGQGINISGNTISAETPEVTITDTGNVTATIEPNTVYSFSDPLTSLSVTLDDSPSGLKLYHFFVKNSDFSSPLTMTINCSNYVFEPSHIASSVSFTLNPRMSYEFSILLRGFTAYVKKSSFGLP